MWRVANACAELKELNFAAETAGVRSRKGGDSNSSYARPLSDAVPKYVRDR